MGKLEASQFAAVLRHRIELDGLAKRLYKSEPELSRLHDECVNGEGNADDDIIGLIQAASACLEQVLEKR